MYIHLLIYIYSFTNFWWTADVNTVYLSVHIYIYELVSKDSAWLCNKTVESIGHLIRPHTHKAWTFYGENHRRWNSMKSIQSPKSFSHTQRMVNWLQIQYQLVWMDPATPQILIKSHFRSPSLEQCLVERQHQHQLSPSSQVLSPLSPSEFCSISNHRLSNCIDLEPPKTSDFHVISG